MSLVLTNATVIDGTGRAPFTGAIAINQSLIDSVEAPVPGCDATVIDMTGLTVLPGLIDLHTHLGSISIGDPESLSPAVTAAHIFHNAELCLTSGHTSARDVGGVDGGLKQAIDMALIPGPRLFPSGPLLCQSGGHGDYAQPHLAQHHRHDPGIPGLAQMSVVCDGPDEVRIAARNAFRRGATQIKMCLSGGVVSLTDSLEDTQFTVEEIRAAVVEAQARNTYVTAHVHNNRSILAGLEAGVECFEHGSHLDEFTAKKMAAADAALVPTFSVRELMRSKWHQWGVPEEALPRLVGVQEAQAASVKLAADAGVRIGSGSDLLGPDQAARGLELTMKSRVLSPMAAIISATSTSAGILRRSDLGVLAPSKTADVIAIDFDPLTEPDKWQDPNHVVLVVKAGVIVKDARS